jgi:hypothetical protein
LTRRRALAVGRAATAVPFDPSESKSRRGTPCGRGPGPQFGIRVEVRINRSLFGIRLTKDALLLPAGGGYADHVLARRLLAHGLPRALARVPVLKHLPVVRLLAIGELALVARRHMQHLDPVQRRRLAQLVRRGRRLTPSEREELRGLVALLDTRAFAGSALQRLSPLPLPRRLTRARY